MTKFYLFFVVAVILSVQTADAKTTPEAQRSKSLWRCLNLEENQWQCDNDGGAPGAPFTVVPTNLISAGSVDIYDATINGVSGKTIECPGGTPIILNQTYMGMPDSCVQIG